MSQHDPIAEPREKGFRGYHLLMQKRVRNILLVASPYDHFIIDEESRFAESGQGASLESGFSVGPRFHHVPQAWSALGLLERQDFDLVLTTPHFADMSATRFAQRVQESHPDLPVAMLTYDRVTAESYAAASESSHIDPVFLWTGEPSLLTSLVRLVEDRLNVAQDTELSAVRVILLIEDSPTFYSSYLPLVYAELTRQTLELLPEGLNQTHRIHRMQARPKVLLARSFEQGQELFQRYRDFLLGVITDLHFPRAGFEESRHPSCLDPQEPLPEPGAELIRWMRGELPDIPILLQSSDPRASALAVELGVCHVDKGSTELLPRLRDFVRNYFGFGPFVFRLPGGEPLGLEARTMREMVDALRVVPDASLRFHAERNHISNWLMARTEYGLAFEVRPRHVQDFLNTQEMREYLVAAFQRFLDEQQKGQVADFQRFPSVELRDFNRIGTGSMGGKGRGLAFLAHVLARHPLHARHPEVEVGIPQTVVLCTEIFDRLCERDALRERALQARTDRDVAELFLAQPLDSSLMRDLAAFLEHVRHPLAVRSSSLLDDSEFQPLAGLYQTLILPNTGSDRLRLEQLARAIRLVFASTFYAGPRAFMAATDQRLEDEKMAVLIQRAVGRTQGGRFYPHFSGVAQSHDFFPPPGIAPEHGTVRLALGFGRSVVEGGRALRFSPRNPQMIPGMANATLARATSQRRFFALPLDVPSKHELPLSLDDSLVALDLSEAELDGTLESAGATLCAETGRIYDTIHRVGERVVNFAPILKFRRFPLSSLLKSVLDMGVEGLGTAVELEFAGNMATRNHLAELSLLQIRPLVADSMQAEIDLGPRPSAPEPFLMGPAFGNGIFRDLRDVVYLHPSRFDPAKSAQAARELASLNEQLLRRQRPYILIGPGRWGSADPQLGIPVSWPEVSGARVIVELARDGLCIDPSQGAHFFHNIAALRVGYFCVDPGKADQHIDLGWLESLPPSELTRIQGSEQRGLVRHVELPACLDIRIDARVRRGLAHRTSP